MKKITLTIKITILLLTIFFLTKVATYENTVLLLNQYTGIVRETPTFDRDEALLVLKNYDMEDSLYVKELLKVNNTWVGNTYNYKEAYEKITYLSGEKMISLIIIQTLMKKEEKKSTMRILAILL
ncbi:hypothetical protein ACW0S4_11365 [Fusobacterium polymorphum]